VRYYSEQLAVELGQAPTVATVAKLVSTVRGGVWGGRHCMESGPTLQEQQAVQYRAHYVLPPTNPSQMNYQNKEMLMGAMIVAGYDEQKGGQVGVATHHSC
jgi:hypothetical protein